ncbi:MAG TPA: hypothetical protein PLP82_12215, partial [Deltaproteobacteria bacterium]|nr:hypothetical protein [Deltaproteobacteria bacterium]
SLIMDRSIDATLYLIDELIRLGLLHYGKGIYRFHHDRIHEAAYSLLSSDEKERLHYRIARRLMEITAPEDLYAKIFYIADQFNKAGNLIETGEEKNAIAELNLKAGMKAKDSTAYAAAANYLKSGMEMLPKKAWREQYDLTYALFMERMECEYLSRNFKESENLFAQIMHNARDKIDRARVCHVMIVLYTNIGKLNEAIALGIDSLRMFGVHLSRRTSKLSVIMELVRFNLVLRRIRIEDIPGMPMMADKEEICSSELSASVGLPAYASNPNLFAVTVLKNAIKSLNNGLTDVSPFAFMALASIYGSALGNYKKAVALGEMALALHEKIGVKAYACKVYFVFGYMILHWRKSLRECVPYFRKAYEAGLDTGDFLYCGNSINTIAHCRIVTGDNIDDILTDFSRYNDFMEGVQDPFITNLHKVHTLFLQYMKGLRSSPFSLPDEDFDVDDYINEMRGSGNLLNVFLILLTKERSNYL